MVGTLRGARPDPAHRRPKKRPPKLNGRSKRTRVVDAPAHSDCGPSSLSRRMKCPGSRNAERGLPDRVSKDAAEGTVFHEVAAMCLEFGLEPDDFLDREFEADGYTFTFDEDFARHMRPGLD